MNIKKYIIAGTLVFLAFQIMDFLIHGLLLMDTYKSLASVWRPEMDSYMWIMMITSLVMSFLFVYIFTKGYEGKGLAEGVRFGLILGLLMNGVTVFNEYAIYPLPLTLIIQWFLFGMGEFIIAGIIVSLIYRSGKV